MLLCWFGSVESNGLSLNHVSQMTEFLMLLGRILGESSPTTLEFGPRHLPLDAPELGRRCGVDLAP